MSSMSIPRPATILLLPMAGLAACSLILDSKPGIGDGDADTPVEAEVEENPDLEGDADGLDEGADEVDDGDGQDDGGEETDLPATFWARSYGGASDDEAYAATAMDDGSFVVAGWTRSFHAPAASYQDMWILELDARGDTVWEKVLGGEGNEAAHSVVATDGGGVVVAGFTESYGPDGPNGVILRLDAGGNLEWTRILGGGYDDRFYSVAATEGGGFVAAGTSDSFSMRSAVWAVDVGADGMILGERIFSNRDDEYDELKATAIQRSVGGSFVLAGSYKANGSIEENVFLMKADDSGECVWALRVDSSDLVDGVGLGILALADGTSVVAARDRSEAAGSVQTWILQVNEAGAMLNSLLIGGLGDDTPFGLVQAPDTGVVLFGMTDSHNPGDYNAWMAKVDWGGGPGWSTTYGGWGIDGGDGSLPVSPHAFARVTAGGYIAAGSTESFGAGMLDAWVLRVDVGGGLGGGCTDIITTYTLPEPSSPNVPGETVNVSSGPAGSTVDLNLLPSGDSAAVVRTQCPE